MKKIIVLIFLILFINSSGVGVFEKVRNNILTHTPELEIIASEIKLDKPLNELDIFEGKIATELEKLEVKKEELKGLQEEKNRSLSEFDKALGDAVNYMKEVNNNKNLK